jgi:hypothetical protein
LADITDAKYFIDLMKRKVVPGAIELYAICDMEQVHVRVFDASGKWSSLIDARVLWMICSSWSK